MAVDAFHAARRDEAGQLTQDAERVAVEAMAVGAAVRVVDVLEGERVARLDAARQIRIATGDEHEVAVQRAVGPEITRAVDARVKPVVGAEDLQRAPHRHELGGRAGHEERVGVVCVDGRVRVERQELDTEDGVAELRTGHDGLDADRQGCRALARGMSSQPEPEHDCGEDGLSHAASSFTASLNSHVSTLRSHTTA